MCVCLCILVRVFRVPIHMGMCVRMQPPTIHIAKTKQDHNIAAERFKRELEILCSLASSPHVVPVIGVCFTEREIILLMQVLACA